MIYQYECLAETLSMAESLGWEEPDDEPETESDEYAGWIDEVESEAIEHIRAAGYTVTGYDD